MASPDVTEMPCVLSRSALKPERCGIVWRSHILLLSRTHATDQLLGSSHAHLHSGKSQQRGALTTVVGRRSGSGFKYYFLILL